MNTSHHGGGHLDTRLTTGMALPSLGSGKGCSSRLGDNLTMFANPEYRQVMHIGVGLHHVDGKDKSDIHKKSVLGAPNAAHQGRTDRYLLGTNSSVYQEPGAGNPFVMTS